MIIKRDILAKIQPFLQSQEAIVIIGMRRVGKTTVLRTIFSDLPSNNKIFLDLENPVNQKYFEQKNYDAVLDAWQALGLNSKERGYVFLDEIQLAKNSPSVVKYLSDHYPLKFFLSGSASFYLKNLFSESLAGRKYIFELWPLTFGEFLRLKNAPLAAPAAVAVMSEPLVSQYSRYYEEYILYGGFPGVVSKTTIVEKKAALEEIFSSYFQLEVLQISDFRKTSVLRDLMLLLLERVGTKLDIQKLAAELGVARQTIAEYLSFLEQTYFIHLVRPFSRNRDTEIRVTPKVYACDSGLANHFSALDKGRLFEQAVFGALRAHGEVNYYQRKSGVELDFILNKKQGFEIKLSPASGDRRKMLALASELKLARATLVAERYVVLPDTTYGFLL